MNGKKCKALREYARQITTEKKTHTLSSGRVYNSGYRPLYQRLKKTFMDNKRERSELGKLIKNGGSRASNRNVRENTK